MPFRQIQLMPKDPPPNTETEAEIDIRGSEASSGLAGPARSAARSPAESSMASESSIASAAARGLVAPGADASAGGTASGPVIKKVTRQTFDADELAIVLSHYDLGVLREVREFPRGSRRAPKLLLRGQEDFLLKRRAKGKDDGEKVAFCHAVQAHLAARQFPLPRLIPTRSTGASMLQHRGLIYEMFEFIKGTPYDRSREATFEAGKILGLFHKLLRDFDPGEQPARGTYHASRTVATALSRIPATLQATEPDGDAAASATLVDRLRAAYIEAVQRVEREGLNDWPMQIIHTDWHPGNMLFQGTRVVAVIDFDASRLAHRIIDAANGALQFSILGASDDTDAWPDHIDEDRFRTFIAGYDQVPEAVMSRAELRAVPWLMIEALIAECAIPIAATGMFSRLPGGRFLQMVNRKVEWMQQNADRLVSLVDG